MNRWNETSDFHSSRQGGPGRDFFGRAGSRRQGFDRWAERTRFYLKTRTVDHWLMFVAGLVIGTTSVTIASKNRSISFPFSTSGS